MSPHIYAEEMMLESIRRTRKSFTTSDLRERLAKHHADVDSTFYAWSDMWLNPKARGWNLEDEIQTIACSMLAIQGEDDEYGSLEQLCSIQRQLPSARVLVLPRCEHSAYLEQPAGVIGATGALLSEEIS